MKIQAKKSLGQNFLKSQDTVSLIVKTGETTSNDFVLEIGPGEGVLTQELLKSAGKVIAIEKDLRLIGDLKEKFQAEINKGNLLIIEGDALTYKMANILPNKYKLIANIPYYITGAIFRSFLEREERPELMVVLVQKEVAERIVAKDGKESLLSISIKAFGDPKYIKTISRSQFKPQPNVDSAIIKISNISEHKFGGLDKDVFFKILHAGFKYKRKKLISNLAELFNKSEIEKAFKEVSLSENARAEELSFQNWLNISKILSKC
jgi:16S rRNA (adenine1518-N6/adenine1519-N6)-dimethyltransferase